MGTNAEDIEVPDTSSEDVQELADSRADPDIVQGTPATSTAEAQGEARKILNRVSQRQADIGKLRGDIEANAEASKSALIRAQKFLLQNYSATMPSQQELQARQSAAMMRPNPGVGSYGAPEAMGANFQSELASESEERRKEIAGYLSAASGEPLQQSLDKINQLSVASQEKLLEMAEKSDTGLGRAAMTALGRSLTPVKPTKAANQQLKIVDVGGGKKQRILFDPGTGQQTPQGEPFSDLGEANEPLAQKIANYDYQPITGYALTRPGSAGQPTMDRVFEINPDYKETIYPQIAKTRLDFTTGQEARKKTSINTSINHLGTLDQAMDALHNGDIKGLNFAANTLGLQSGTSAPAVYDAIKGMVGSELATAVSLTSGVSEREAAAQRVSRDFSGPVSHDITKSYRKLLAGRMDSLYGQYQAGMGLAAFPEGSDAYKKQKDMIDREFFTGLNPHTIAATHPAPPEAVQDYMVNVKAHPELRQAFKDTFHYLPEEVQ